MGTPDATLLQIGRNIRARRARQRMTLGDLERRSGLSQSFLSKVERGQAQTSIANLIRIADAVGSSLHELIGSPAPAAAAAGYRVFRAGEAAAPAINAAGYRWQPVSGGGPGRSMAANLLTFPADPPADTRFAHPGEELCFVLEGRVRFTVGEAAVVLAAGDAIHLRSDIPHGAGSEDGGTARVLMVTHHAHGATAFPDWWNHHSGGAGHDSEEETA